MKREKNTWTRALKAALGTLYSMTPMLLAVIGLVGLFQTYITPEMIHSFFTGSALYDTLIGTVTGAISVGQPFISYIIGDGLSHQGVSLYAVTAFILSFVTLGVVQLPMEYTLFGMRFTLVRNLLSFLFSILVSVMTVWTLEVLL